MILVTKGCPGSMNVVYTVMSCIVFCYELYMYVYDTLMGKCGDVASSMGTYYGDLVSWMGKYGDELEPWEYCFTNGRVCVFASSMEI